MGCEAISSDGISPVDGSLLADWRASLGNSWASKWAGGVAGFSGASAIGRAGCWIGLEVMAEALSPKAGWDGCFSSARSIASNCCCSE